MDKVYLQCFDNASLMLELNSLQIVKKSISETTRGWYYRVQEKISALYFSENTDYFIFGKLRIVIREELFAKCQTINNQNWFELFDNNVQIIRFIYTIPYSANSVHSNLFGFVEDEDFNWGLFLKNIINNKDRRNIIRLTLK